MTGDPKSGKKLQRASCYNLLLSVKHNTDQRVIYLNTEGRLSKQNFDGIKGLDPEAYLIVQSTDDKICISRRL